MTPAFRLIAWGFAAVALTFLALVPLRAWAQGAAAPGGAGWVSLGACLADCVVSLPSGAAFVEFHQVYRSAGDCGTALDGVSGWVAAPADFPVTVSPQACTPDGGATWSLDPDAAAWYRPLYSAEPPASAASGVMSYGSEHLGAWVATLGAVLCLGLGFVAGGLR